MTAIRDHDVQSPTVVCALDVLCQPRRTPAAPPHRAAPTTAFDVLITNGRVVDGTGAPWFRADVGIIGDRDRGDRPAVEPRGDDAHRRVESGGRARLHRHARPVRVQRPGRSARRQQDHAGHHDRDHRRGSVDRAAQRRARQVGAAAVRPLQGGARLPHAQRLFRAPREEPAGDQRRHLRRRRRPARLRDRAAARRWRRRTTSRR